MSGRDEGFATLAVLALCGVLTAAGGLVAVLGEIAVARHQAAAAADLAALAAAGRAREGPEVVCWVARAVAARNHAAVMSCAVDGLDVQVMVAVEAGRWGVVRSRARAGPSRG
jgi:secretion/DNA translocation related TadE-like protein